MIENKISSNQSSGNIDIITNGRWTSTEHKYFLEGIMTYGLLWKKVIIL
jgi:hypothetical protein